ncbi:MerR family transcriptional regulator [Romboutsia ilealis]|nr:MerR family transcriptional regulator [Romboutsia ilealis]
MKENLIYFTAGEFAKFHHINKRTLHYYDSVGIFSPKHKGENGYRYYTYSQSIDLENILALREVNMSIEEIQNYIKNPNALDFQNIAKKKISEIDNTISQLKKLKNILKQKSKSLDLCKDVYDGKIELVHLNEEFLLMTPLVFETYSCLMDNSNAIIKHLKA